MLSRFFHVQENNTTIRREILAGFTSFFTLAYILVLIPSLLSEAGMDFSATMVATILVGAYASFMMGIVANYPFVLAPGVALSAYFTYSVVLRQGHQWQITLGIVLITGIFLLILNLLGIRQLIIEAIPSCIRLATTGGLGLFLAIVGLKNAGIIVLNEGELLSFTDPRSLPNVLTAIGLVVMGSLMVLRIPGALFLGMLIVWFLGYIFGYTKWEGFLSLPSSLAPTFLKLDIPGVFAIRHLPVLLSFLFVTLFDSTATLLALAEKGGFLKEGARERKMCIFPRVTRALVPDTTGTILAPLLGTTAVAVYPESAAGISVGGKTGLTAITSSCLFLLALFFTPFASSIPSFAIAPVLIIVGALMLQSFAKLDWKDPSEWIPAFTTLILIPLTYNIAVGLAVGYITYCLIKLFSAKVKEVHWLSWTLAALFTLKFIFFPTL